MVMGVLVLAAAAAPAHAEAPAPDPGTVLVAFEPGTAASEATAVAKRYGVGLGERLKGTRFRVVTTGGKPARLVERRLERAGAVATVEPNHTRRPLVVPNDPLVEKGRMHWLDTVRMPEAWDRAKGTPAQILAVVDDGVDARHADLPHVLPEIDVVGTPPYNVGSSEGHGTAVAGVAAAQADNDVGIAGAAWSASILPVRVIRGSEDATDANVAQGIVAAADAGADVINLSLGGPAASAVLQEAVAYAIGKDAVVVAAAGNEGTDEPMYPAALPGVVSVGATDPAGNLARFSSFGDTIDLAAPGSEIPATRSAPLEWEFFPSERAGTSFAAPIVSGVAILLRAANPGWTQAQVADRLRATASDAGPRGPDPYYGAGVLDAAAALGAPAAAQPPPLFDGDGTFATAKRVTAGPVRARFDVQGDEDWYAMRLPSAGRWSMRLADAIYGQEAEGTVPYIELYSASGQLLKATDRDAFGGPYGIGHEVDGPTEVVVRVANDAPSRSAEEYVLDVTHAPSEAFVRQRFLREDLPDVLEMQAPGDVDCDGRVDLVGATRRVVDGYWRPALAHLRQMGDGYLDLPRDGPRVPGDDFPGDVASGRIDAGDCDDVAVATPAGVHVFAGATGGPGAASLVPGTEHAIMVETADLDRDGLGDLVVVTAPRDGSARSLLVLRNTAGGWVRTVLSSAAHIDVAVGDLDGNGRLDVAASQASPLQRVDLFRQRSDGTWAADARATYPGSLAIGDATGDGFDDLVVRDESQQARVLVFAQDAAHGLAPPSSHSTTGGYTSAPVLVGEFTGDGRPDMAADGLLFVAQPEGGFAREQLLGPATQSGDLNDDGALDLIAPSLVLRRPTATWPLGAWVLDATPSDGAAGVAAAAAPAVRFGRDLAPGAVGTATVRLERAGSDDPLPAALDYDASQRRATLRPASPLSEGSYDLVVHGVQGARGERMDERFAARFTVGGTATDATAPDTRIRSGGWNPYDDEAGFAFYATERASRFECRMDDGEWKQCRSVRRYDTFDGQTETLVTGDHVFAVRAIDAAGNVDGSPATRAFRVTREDHETPSETLTGTSGSRSVPSVPRGHVAYRWQAPADGTLTLDTDGSAFDTVLEVREVDGVWEEEPLAEDDDGGAGLASRTVLPVRSGRLYSIVITAWRDRTGFVDGEARLRWAFSAVTDATPPDTLYDEPAEVTGMVDFRSTEPASTFECNIDGGEWVVCEGGHWPGYPGLEPGSHTVGGRAIDYAGNVDPTPATYTFVQPGTELQTYGGIEGVRTTGTVGGHWYGTVSGSGPDTTLLFDCRLDGGAWQRCTPSTTFTVRDGLHRFEVRAVTVEGEVDASPARTRFAVDTTPPDVTIVAGPTSDTAERTADFRFVSEPGALLECRLDDDLWRPCRSPRPYGALTPGSHTFQVRATDDVGHVDPTPATRTWTVGTTPPPPPPDTTAPDTTITGGPGDRTEDTTPSWSFSSPEAGVTFECRVDALPWLPCTSPYTAPELADGTHRFEARAVDAAGNADPTPASGEVVVARPVEEEEQQEEVQQDEPPARVPEPLPPVQRASSETPAPPPAPPLPEAPADRRPPTLTRLAVDVARRGLALRLTADEPATLSVRFERRVGRRIVRLRGSIGLRARPGANRLAIGRRLRAGRYQLFVTATDAAGNRRTLLSRVFTVRSRR